MSIDRCLGSLDEAIAAAKALGLDATAAISTRETALSRLGFPSSAYVLALAGGTGVGKSTLLNSIAGENVSQAGARRPTTSDAVAWVPSSRGRELDGLLKWLGVGEIREHAGGALADVAVLDLPDFDSIVPEHRERVDALLPRVDAVAWIVDPEKYKDQVMHGGYLTKFAPRIRRQIVVLNRSDLLSSADAVRVAEDMRSQLRRDGAGDIDVVATRAKEGAGGVDELRAWLESGIEAKRVVVSRVAAVAREAVRDLAADAGVAGGAPAPLIEAARRERALSSVARGALAVVDIAGLERQAVAATRFAARRRGAGPLRHLTSAIYRLMGRARKSADPAGFLQRWQLRGSLAPALEPLRELITSTLPLVPAPLRGTLARLSSHASLERRLADTIDRSLAGEVAGFRVPTSALWSVIGAAQYATTALLFFAVLWFASLLVIHDAPVSAITAPYLGFVPTPVALLAATLLAGYLLASLLRLHAGWLGRRWAKRVGARVSLEVRHRVVDELLVPLDQFEASRAALSKAVSAADDCP
ncbi:MAG TPA: GTPase [Candidatus Limnocylindrales bacterium]|nr:GTPase [Candidatus Limnocylindrales bacterium]